MTRSASPSLQCAKFDDFLFAPIGAEANGMSLSVISALARLDLDPWSEAADLARMPRRNAIDRMTALISALPGRTSAHLDPEAIAARVIALLPREASSAAKPVAPPQSGSAVARDVRFIIFVALMAFLLSTQFLTRARQTSADADNTHAPASSSMSTLDTGRRQ